IHRLEKKGYRVTYEKMIVMPSNFAMATPDELAIRLLQVLPSKVELICRDLLRGKIRRPKPILFDQFLSVVGELGRTKISSWIFGKHIKANKNCNGCGLCKANCPMGNIKLINRKPVFHSRCALCLKCIYRCPKGALSPGIGKFIILKDGYPLKKWENQMNDKLPAIDYNSYGYAFSGIVKYLKEDEKR
ncbi:MAG TPA: EFR1 family ferrodoxin, partial [Mobilitalea sp.]|nr:EFR1 family ferrodoxin [Mobilitalea sp.]